MPSSFFRLLLTSTSLAPVMLIYAVLQFSNQFLFNGLLLSALFVVLVVSCYLLLVFVEKHVPPTLLNVNSVKLTNKNMLSFLVVYFLPMLSNNFNVFYNPLAGIVMLVIVFLLVFRIDAFCYNPV
jgi:hypothetical protein